MKKAMLLFLLFSLFVSALPPVNAQETIPTDIFGKKITLDTQGNVYVTSGPSLYKLDGNGQLLYKYVAPLSGEITSLDVDDPMKIMLFFKESGKIIFLNDKLAPLTQQLDLFSCHYHNISLVAYSTDNTLWLYDFINQELINVDFFLKELGKNPLTEQRLNPIQLLSVQEKRLVLNDPATGILIFDAFGTHITTLPFLSKRPVQVTGTIVFYLKDNVLCCYDFLLHQAGIVGDLGQPAAAAVCNASKIYYLDADSRLNIISRK